MGLDLEKLKAYLESDEGKASIDRMNEKWRKEDEFKIRWGHRIADVLTKKSSSELDILFEAYNKHDEKRRDILWKQGYDGESSLNSYILIAIEKLGTGCPEENFGMFTSCMYEWNGFIGELICGQGCFTKIYKKK